MTSRTTIPLCGGFAPTGPGPRTFDREDSLQVTYTSSGGDVLEFQYDGPRLLNGTPVDPSTTRLYDGPFMSADVGSGVIELRYGGRTRILDFPQARIIDR